MENFVANIGGVFLHSKDPKTMIEWYTRVLKMKHESWSEDGSFGGLVFNYIDESTGKKAYIVWSISSGKNLDSDHPRLKTHVINLRVNNLNKLVEHIKNEGVEVKGIETHNEGLFAWVTDPDGNSVELWEDTES